MSAAVLTGGAADALAFRAMEMDDLGVVVRNETRSYAYPWTAGIFTDCLGAGHECRLALHRGGIIGHGVLSAAVGEAHLLNICVSRDRQGEGFGRRLLEHMIERARLREAGEIFLEVRVSNRVACRLYESVGFREVGRRRDYYRTARGHEDALVMALELES